MFMSAYAVRVCVTERPAVLQLAKWGMKHSTTGPGATRLTVVLRLTVLQFKDGELDLQPSYQRGLVWDKKMTSRLVVTALEGRVLPTVYLEQGEQHPVMTYFAMLVFAADTVCDRETLAMQHRLEILCFHA
jgi:hypothetical protein